MIRKPITSLFFITLLASTGPVFADTNVTGDEIVIDTATDIVAGDPAPTSFNDDGLQMDLLLRNTPDAASVGPQSGDLWQRIRNGYGMETLQSPFTAVHESWYASRPEYMQRMVERSQRYLFHVVEEVQKRGMPTEVALLPMVESAFNPTAYSRSKASGIWQFIPSTGKNFGLKQNWWADNRRDVTAATDAALNYLEKLHVMFGTWELALAAYNAGEGTVQRAIERNRRKGLPTDYQSLPLPPETRNYVPKLQAVKNIVTNPQQYGLNIAPIPDQPYFTKVVAPAKIDVDLAARLAGVSVAEFTALNPAHNRPVIASDGKQEILLPMGKEAEFEQNLASYDKPLVSWQTYQAKRGERLANISNKFGISVAQLRDVNDISARGRISPNQPLLVPARGENASTESGIEVDAPVTQVAGEDAVQQCANRHRVKRGDSVYSIAKRYGMTTRQLMALNSLKKPRLQSGQMLVVAPGTSVQPLRVAESTTPVRAKTRYRVKRGETLASIARKFNVAASDLRRWNNLGGKRSITPGRTLIIVREEA